MSDPRRKLANLWGPSSRFNEFGNVISKLVVSGVRCHTQTSIEFRSPITAFSGFNGTGKSTMLQLCAAAYVCQEDYMINSFMRKGPLDQTVFSATASIQCLIQRLEAMPQRSLILLEEPEISLHPSAEYELGKYLLDLIDRKRHQVLLTTHSSMLLRSLPDASLVFLARHGDTITPLPGIGARQAASLLTEGHDKALTVLVEDEAAKLVLTELIRHHNPGFLATLHIAVARERRESGRIDASGKDAIRSTMKTLSEAGLKLAAVLDGGEAVDSQRYIFCLPGREPPESELFKSPSARRMIEATYNLKIEDLEAELAGADCHQIFKTIGRRTSCDEAYLIQEAARAYVHDVPAADVNRLIELLKEASQRR